MRKTGFVIMDKTIKSPMWIAHTYEDAEDWINQMVECGAWNRKDLIIEGVGIVSKGEKLP